MASSMVWLEEGKVIGLRCWGHLQIRELELISQRILGLVNALDASDISLVHIMCDFRELESIKSSISLLAAMNFLNHPCIGWSIIIGVESKTPLRFSVSMIYQLRSLRHHYANSSEEACKHLKHVDSSVSFETTLLSIPNEAVDDVILISAGNT